MSKIYPVGIQSFEKIRKGGYCYIDKTSLIYNLVKSGQYYFLSRPRRFGKSLLISTLEAYFLGKKELFKGLAMEKLEKDWTTYPVLHLDLNTQKYDTPKALTDVLEENLSYWENLYGALKSNDYYLRFALLTGVTKFSKVRLFSDLNNLMDISINDRFASICGITEHELHTDFKEDILALAQKNRITEDEAKQQLKNNTTDTISWKTAKTSTTRSACSTLLPK